MLHLFIIGTTPKIRVPYFHKQYNPDAVTYIVPEIRIVYLVSFFDFSPALGYGAVAKQAPL